jgi:dTDP-D-glucose 4,6-dehydratase
MDKVLILTGMAGFIGMNLLNEMIKDTKFLKSYKKIISIDKMGYATQYNKHDYYNTLPVDRRWYR